MPRFLSVISILIFVIPTAVAEINYRDFRMASWDWRAEDCGEIYQSYVAYDVEHLLGNLREDMWRRVRELGATEDEIVVLERRFEAGRKKAMEKPHIKSPPENYLDIGIMIRRAEADWKYKYCTDTLE